MSHPIQESSPLSVLLPNTEESAQAVLVDPLSCEPILDDLPLCDLPLVGEVDLITAPLTATEIKESKTLKTSSKNKDEDTLLCPVPEEAPVFSENTCSWHNRKFGCKPSAFYRYDTEEGRLAGYIVRWDTVQEEGPSKKEIIPYVYVQDKQGNKRWKGKGFAAPRPLYNLFEIMSRPHDVVLIGEGEAVAEAGKILFPDFVSTTSMHGSQSPGKTDWSPLKGRDVIISPDFDTAGQRYAGAVTAYCHKAEVRSIRYLAPETFHLLSLSYFEEKARYDGGMVPRVNMPQIFGEEAEQESTQQDIAIEIVTAQNAEIKKISEKPPTMSDLRENGGDDAAEVLSVSGLLGRSPPPFDHTRKVPEGYDLADSLKEGWTAALMDAVRQEIGEDTFFPVKLMHQIKALNLEDKMFTLKPSGVYQEGTKVCGYVLVVASCRNDQGKEWQHILEIIDKDGQKKEDFIPLDLLVKDGSVLSERLISQGVWVNADPKTGRQNLKYYLNQTPKLRALSVKKVGWQGRNYVLPEKVYGPQEKEKIILTMEGRKPSYKQKGLLQSWQDQIGRYAEGNSRLQISILIALAAPTLTPLQKENFGLHLIGNSSCGKSTALRVACSVFGSEFHSWRTTDNSAESWATSCNDNLLSLDDMGQASAESIGEISYMLGNGEGKGRANRKGVARNISTFKNCVISTGELGIQAKLNERKHGKQSYQGGQAVRMVEIPADAGKGLGLFETVHDFKNGAQFSDHLNASAKSLSGMLGDAWLTYLTENYEEALEKLAAHEKEWLVRSPLEHGTDGQVNRVRNRFALMAAVGELAIEQGLLPWATGSASKACSVTFEAWLQRRGGVESHEVIDFIRRVTLFLQEEGSARFELMRQPERKTGDVQEIYPDMNKTVKRAGFREYKNKVWVYYIFQEVFENELLMHGDKKILLTAMAERGMLKREGHRFCRQKRLPGMSQKTRVYWAQLSEEDDGDP